VLLELSTCVILPSVSNARFAAMLLSRAKLVMFTVEVVDPSWRHKRQPIVGN